MVYGYLMATAAAIVGAGASIVGGRKSRKASKRAARAQEAAAQAALDEQRRQFDVSQSVLAPFRTFGQQQLGPLADILTAEGQASFLEGNPLFEFGLQNLNEQTANIAAARGRLGAGDTREQFLENAFLAGSPLLANQMNALFNAANIGQSSAAGAANIGVNAGIQNANLLTQIGNAQAAGRVGQAQAFNQAIPGVVSALPTILQGVRGLFR